MNAKNVGILNAILWGIGLILLLAAAFDIFPKVNDNKLIFFALSCFIITTVINRISKGGGCCK